MSGTGESVKLELELMPDGKWYGTLWIGGLQKAGSGRRETPAAVFAWMEVDLLDAADRSRGTE